MVGQFVNQILNVITAWLNWMQILYNKIEGLPYLLGVLFAILIFRNLIFPLIGSTVGSDGSKRDVSKENDE